MLNKPAALPVFHSPSTFEWSETHAGTNNYFDGPGAAQICDGNTSASNIRNNTYVANAYGRPANRGTCLLSECEFVSQKMPKPMMEIARVDRSSNFINVRERRNSSLRLLDVAKKMNLGIYLWDCIENEAG